MRQIDIKPIVYPGKGVSKKYFRITLSRRIKSYVILTPAEVVDLRNQIDDLDLFPGRKRRRFWRRRKVC